MRRTIAVLGITAVLASAAVSFTVLSEITAAAESTDATFLVPANDGYGVGECLAAGGECGRVIANAWCETQGFRRATLFGQTTSEDLTGGVQPASTAAASRSVAITCTK
jgi:hypothetical protein